ncbi:MAG: PHP domain-containing protein [Veillonellales bacterium]
MRRTPIGKVDLHIHTTASDGTWSAEKLTEEVKKAGIDLFSVTDHDTVANTAAAQQAAAAAGLAFLAGVELTSTIRDQSFHILGYGIDPLSEPLRKLAEHNTVLMEETDRDSIKKLIDDGFLIDYDEYCRYQHEPARGGWKSLSFLIDKGFCRDIHDFFTNLFTAERNIVWPAFPSPSTVIQVIKKAGGKAVLAHPGSGFHGSCLEETLDFFAGETIDGVECFHPGHDTVVTRQAVDWCNRYHLLITGGSDCHGDFVAERHLGQPEIYFGQLRLAGLADRIQ